MSKHVICIIVDLLCCFDTLFLPNAFKWINQVCILSFALKVILYYDVSTRLTKCDLLIEDCEWHCILNLLPKFVYVCVLMNECEEKKNKTDEEYIFCFI